MFIAEETVSRIREACDIVEVVSEFLPSLKRAGKDYKALCPFHQEKSPSFMVSPSKGIFHCFGCGVGGDSFKFVMEMEHCSYPEAIRKLAEKKGIPILEKTGSLEISSDQKKRKRILETVRRAAQYYHKALLESKEAQSALDYLKGKRGLTQETIEKFELGWAPWDGQSLLKSALKSGITDLELEEAGLAKKYTDSNKWVDHFRGRILFPIFDNKGQAIGFGGRILESSKSKTGEVPPKYINSPETPIFQKGKNLYGFYHGARDLRTKNRAIVVEGYMDVIGCHQSGIAEAIAPLGTSLTSDQCQLLKRSVENVTLLFDADPAGEQASFRGAELLMDFGFMPLVAQLPEGIDSDEYLQNHSKEEFEALIAKSITIFEFKCDLVQNKNGNLPTAVVKSMTVKSLLPLLLKLEDQILRSEMVRLLARKCGVKEESLLLELKKAQSPKGTRVNLTQTQNKIIPQHELLDLEEELISLAVKDESLRKELIAHLEEKDFKNIYALEVFKALKGVIEGSNIGSVLNNLKEPSSAWLRNALFRQREVPEPSKIFALLIERKKSEREMTELEVLEREFVLVLNSGGKMSSEDSSRYQQLTRSLKGTVQK